METIDTSKPREEMHLVEISLAVLSLENLLKTLEGLEDLNELGKANVIIAKGRIADLRAYLALG